MVGLTTLKYLMGLPIPPNSTKVGQKKLSSKHTFQAQKKHSSSALFKREKKTQLKRTFQAQKKNSAQAHFSSAKKKQLKRTFQARKKKHSSRALFEHEKKNSSSKLFKREKKTQLKRTRVGLPGAGANRFRPTAGGVCP